MLFFCGISFMFIGVILGDSCWDRQFSCGKDMPRDFPKNEEELQSGCRIFKDAAKCVLNVLENCEEEYENDEVEEYHRKEVAGIRKMEQFLIESCNPDTSIYQVISRNLGCAYSALKTFNNSCSFGYVGRRSINVLMAKYREEYEGRGESSEYHNCVNGIMDSVCMTALVRDECGSEVITLLTKVLSSLNLNIQLYCAEEMTDLIPVFAEILVCTCVY